jgi:hypothetical protein
MEALKSVVKTGVSFVASSFYSLMEIPSGLLALWIWSPLYSFSMSLSVICIMGMSSMSPLLMSLMLSVCQMVRLRRGMDRSKLVV